MLSRITDIAISETTRAATQFYQSLWQPGWQNYLYVLVGLSLFFWLLEILIPWRRNQSIFRKDFWLDGFYMFFNLFIFPILGFAAAAAIVEFLFLKLSGVVGVSDLTLFDLSDASPWILFPVLFILRDFIQWNVHVLLHRIPVLWEFHKVHHSVEQMGFAAHLRYHWMENIVYRMFEYIPLHIIGFGATDFFYVYAFTLAIGHFNHSNIKIPLGPLKYILNNPQMHIWHHARELPGKYGVNFGITLSVWDYIFRTAYIPHSGRDVSIGYEGMEREMPSGFGGQLIFPFYKKKMQKPVPSPAT